MKDLKKQEKTALIAFKKTLFAKLGNNISGLFLYGSKARGTATETSDMDVLVIVNRKSPEVIKKVSNISFDIILNYGVDLSVVVYSKNDWLRYKNTPTAFSFSVTKDAVKL